MQRDLGRRARARPRRLDPAPGKLVANLPYNIATPLVVETLEHARSLEQLVRDGAARGRRSLLRGAAYEGVWRGLGARPARGPEDGLPRRLRRRCSGRAPRVESALVAFDRAARRADLERSRRRRGRVRPSPQDGCELDRHRRPRVSCPRRGARWPAIGHRGERPRRGARARSSSSSSRKRCDEPRAGVREDQPRARRRPAAQRRQARRPHRAAEGRAPRRGSARAVDGSRRRGVRRRHDRSRRARVARRRGTGRAELARADRQADPGGGRPRWRKLGCCRRAAARERAHSRSRCRGRDLHRLAAGVGADVPFFLQTGAQLASATARSSSDIELPLDYHVLLVDSARRREGVHGAPCTRSSTPAAAQRGSSAESTSSGDRSSGSNAARPGGAPGERSRLLTAGGRAGRSRRLSRGRHRRRAHRLRAVRRPDGSRTRARGAGRARLDRAHPPRRRASGSLSQRWRFANAVVFADLA